MIEEEEEEEEEETRWYVTHYPHGLDGHLKSLIFQR